jgi:hypothetical protein
MLNISKKEKKSIKNCGLCASNFGDETAKSTAK